MMVVCIIRLNYARRRPALFRAAPSAWFPLMPAPGPIYGLAPTDVAGRGFTRRAAV